MKIKLSSLRAFISTLIFVGASFAGTSLPQVVRAQTGSMTLIVNGCDSSKYPSVVCTVTPVNGAGVPLQRLDTSSFQVLDGGNPVPEVQVQQVAGTGVKSSIMLVVDFGMVHRGEALQPLKDSAKAILQATSNDDRIAVIAIVGPVNVDSGLDAAKEAGFASAGQKRNDMINLVTNLSAVGSTPLYDAVCKALLLTAQESVGNRAVIVLSDGADVKSKVCSDTDPITRANHDRTPVFTIGVGPDVKEAYLRKLALQTDGDYESAAQLSNVTDIFKRIQSVLKTQYTLTFKMTGEATGQPKPVVIRVLQGANRAEESVAIQTQAPQKPVIDKVSFTIDGADANPMLLPANKTLVIEPKIQPGVAVTQVEYLVGGKSMLEKTPPYQLVIATNDLINQTKITLRLAGDIAKPESFSVTDVSVGIDPSTLVTPTAPSPPTPIATPTPTLLATLTTFPGVLIPISGVGIIVLLILLAIILGRRRSAQSEGLAVNSPHTMVVTGNSLDAASPATAVIDSSPTSVMIGGDSPGGETQILGAGGGQTLVFKAPMALLEFTAGNLSGQQFGIGSTNMEKLSIGRDPEAGSGAVRIVSQYVSRKHATITVDGSKMYLMDMGSSSGTKLNGERLPPSQQREIKIGDKIEFADVTAELKQA